MSKIKIKKSDLTYIMDWIGGRQAISELHIDWIFPEDNKYNYKCGEDGWLPQSAWEDWFMEAVERFNEGYTYNPLDGDIGLRHETNLYKELCPECKGEGEGGCHVCEDEEYVFLPKEECKKIFAKELNRKK